ncbi:hypothetical protein AB833_23210 [Chromatiales bacterium (ex Bugula neritina AB1)]|nr:hypothetical protein AB833_23210 [Chromatiales bacterium (ex Bugula neritina AB1)]
MRVTIVGGSIGGLFTGLALQQRGHDVHIYEAVENDLDLRGAGITTHRALFNAMAALGIEPEDDFGITVRTRKTIATDGTELGAFGFHQVTTSWGRLYQLLLSKFPQSRYHAGVRLEGIHQSEQNGNVRAEFSDGGCIDSELLIGADGIRSAVRSAIAPAALPRYAGYVAWRGYVVEDDLSHYEKEELFPYFTFCLPPNGQVIAYPIAGITKNNAHTVEAGRRRYNIVWYRTADRHNTLQDLLTDINGNNNGESIAPNVVRPEVIKAMRSDAEQKLSPQHASLFARIETPFIQPIYDLESPCMVSGNIALVGDAAFTARPHLGMGTTKAAEDAIALASALGAFPADAQAALSLYEKNRFAAGAAVVRRSRQLGAYLQATHATKAERQYAERHQNPDRIMRETATDQWQDEP